MADVWGLSDQDYNRTTLQVVRATAMVRVIEEACESDTSDAAELLSLLREELERIEALLEKALPAHFEKGADGAEA